LSELSRRVGLLKNLEGENLNGEKRMASPSDRVFPGGGCSSCSVFTARPAVLQEGTDVSHMPEHARRQGDVPVRDAGGETE
jgi:hypothetical protein